MTTTLRNTGTDIDFGDVQPKLAVCPRISPRRARRSHRYTTVDSTMRVAADLPISASARAMDISFRLVELA